MARSSSGIQLIAAALLPALPTLADAGADADDVVQRVQATVMRLKTQLPDFLCRKTITSQLRTRRRVLQQTVIVSRFTGRQIQSSKTDLSFDETRVVHSVNGCPRRANGPLRRRFCSPGGSDLLAGRGLGLSGRLTTVTTSNHKISRRLSSHSIPKATGCRPSAIAVSTLLTGATGQPGSTRRPLQATPIRFRPRCWCARNSRIRACRFSASSARSIEITGNLQRPANSRPYRDFRRRSTQAAMRRRAKPGVRAAAQRPSK